jgi:hypothetical protein
MTPKSLKSTSGHANSTQTARDAIRRCTIPLLVKPVELAWDIPDADSNTNHKCGFSYARHWCKTRAAMPPITLCREETETFSPGLPGATAQWQKAAVC